QPTRIRIPGILYRHGHYPQLQRYRQGHRGLTPKTISYSRLMHRNNSPGTFVIKERSTIMDNNILGIHHITAIASDAKRNYDFYTRVLGLRMVKKTVNFDDPQTYHLYFGDEVGTPGTILTFFPWGNRVSTGRRGPRQVTEIGYAVPAGSLDFWKDRLEDNHVLY